MNERMEGEKLFKSVELKKRMKRGGSWFEEIIIIAWNFSHSKLKPSSHPTKVFLSFYDDDDGSESEDSEAKLISGKASF